MLLLGFTPLHVASNEGQLDVLIYLIGNGSSVKERTNVGNHIIVYS